MYFLLVFLFLTQCSKLMEKQRLTPITNYSDMKKLSLPPPNYKPQEIAPRKKKNKKITFDPVFQKKVSIDISPETDIKLVLRSLGESLGIVVNFTTTKTGEFSYSANGKTFVSVLDDVCDALNLRFSVQGRHVKIEEDKPFFRNYAIHFLKCSRDSENKVSSVTDVFKDKDQDGQVINQDNGSNSTVTVKSSIDFWEELENTFKVMLPDAKFSIHKQAGIVSVMGDTKQQKMVEEYLAHLEKEISSQVLIEAKVIEVKLNQDFKSGINWNLVTKNEKFQINSNLFQQNGEQVFSIGGGKNSDIFSIFLKSLEQFGSLRVVSSPRITVLNNQTAIIKVAENEVFFKVNYQTSYLGYYSSKFRNNDPKNILAPEPQTISTSEIRTKPIGFIMPIQVSINRDTDEVILFVRPTVSRKSGSVIDPAVHFNAKVKDMKDFKESEIPVVEIREIDSVLRLMSGNIAVLGGLMESRSKDKRKGPVGSERTAPAGHILGAQQGEDQVYELVILLKATIVDNQPTYDCTDLRLVRHYASDPRPFI